MFLNTQTVATIVKTIKLLRRFDIHLYISGPHNVPEKFPTQSHVLKRIGKCASNYVYV